MERLRLEQLTALQRVTAAVAGVPPTSVDIVQDVEAETITAEMYGKRLAANCGMDSVSMAMKDFLQQVVLKL